MCLVEEVQGSCWRGARGVIYKAVGSKGEVSVVAQSRVIGMLYADGGSRVDSVESSQDLPGGRAVAPKSGPAV